MNKSGQKLAQARDVRIRAIEIRTSGSNFANFAPFVQESLSDAFGVPSREENSFDQSVLIVSISGSTLVSRD
jgi:hypothetical protein